MTSDDRPKLRRAHTAKGLVLRSRSGVIYVPYEQASAHRWNALTLFDPAGVSGHRGYNISVCWESLEKDEQVWDFEKFPYPGQRNERVVATAEELDALPVDSYGVCSCGYHVAKTATARYAFSTGRRMTTEKMVEDHLPLTVVYTPSRDWEQSDV